MNKDCQHSTTRKKNLDVGQEKKGTGNKNVIEGQDTHSLINSKVEGIKMSTPRKEHSSGWSLTRRIDSYSKPGRLHSAVSSSARKRTGALIYGLVPLAEVGTKHS